MNGKKSNHADVIIGCEITIRPAQDVELSVYFLVLVTLRNFYRITCIGPTYNSEDRIVSGVNHWDPYCQQYLRLDTAFFFLGGYGPPSLKP
jgi:hypothetical protein